LNIALLHQRNYERFGDRVVFVFEDREITSFWMRDRMTRLGNALKGLGVGAGEVVAVTMTNCPEVLLSFGAILRIGASILPILFLLSTEELKYILEDSGAVAVITDSTLEQKVLEAAGEVETVRNVIVVGAEDRSRALDFEQLLREAAPQLPITDREWDDVALMMYTSGTTGRPKGVLLTHRNLIEAARSTYLATEVTRPLNGLLALPLAHIYGVAAMDTAIFNEFPQSRGVVLRWFSAEEAFRVIEKYRVARFPGVPAMFSLMLDHPAAEDYDLGSLEDCVSGAAPLPPEVQLGFIERFGCNLRQAYGLTEATAMGAQARPGDPLRPGTAGRAYETLELKVFDYDDNEMPAGVDGEVVLRGPQVMKGYHNLPDETALVLRNGWLHTGDIGYLDDEGFLYITGREKDLIIKGGENIMPAQIEEVLCLHESVAEAAVIGVEHEVYGEDIVACVTLEPGAAATPEEILEFCAGRLSSFKRPREVRIVEALPRNVSGKVLKRELKRAYDEGNH
jgi:long-chain acyl-CoA synthetase